MRNDGRLYPERITMNKLKYFFFHAFFSSLLVMPAFAQDVSFEERRLAGFSDHQQKNRELEKERLSDVSEVNKARLNWEKKADQGIAEYKKSRRQQEQELSERGRFYQEDADEKQAYDRALEKARQAYVIRKIEERRKTTKKLAVTEEEELGLNDPFIRADKNKRKVLTESGTGNSRGGSAGGYTAPPAYNPPSDFGNDFEPPPPINAGAPEFFEPESIPPPPPPEGFDEPIPPPIFDEPEF